MNRSQNILADNTLVEHDSILVVVTLPRHICHKEVTTQSKFTVLSSITFSQDITLLDALSLITDRTQVDGHILVGTTELRDTILFQSRFKRYELLVLSAVVQDTDSGRINILDDTLALSGDHRTRVLADLFLNTCTNNRSLVMKQGYGLAHHVRSHQCTVGIIVLQERNERCSDRGNLLGRHVHQVNICRGNNREICILTTLHHLTDKCTVVVQRGITLTNDVL